MRGINRVLKERPDKVVFASFNGDAYSDNPRAISEALHHERPNLELVWLIKNPSEKRDILPSYVRCVRFRSVRALYALATARVWVDNTTKAPYVYKSPSQFYMQTWHGDRGFKTMLLDSPNYLMGRRMVERECDLILTGSAHAERVYRSAFKYEGNFLRHGSPRNDLLIKNDQDRKASVRSALGIPQGAKVLLYAPTYRHEDAACFRAQTVELDVASTLDALERGGACWVCLLRGHSKVRGLKGAGDDPRVLDANSWEDMAELLLIADMLVSDYSSSVGDFALTGRPILLFQPDFARFRGERTFYFDMDASPFWIARDQAALEERIEKLTPEASNQNDREILAFFGACETGDATSAAVRAILDAIDAK
jgi:CDP-glycerol glycerophosphotransferase